jgi:hypothetical protein
MAKKATTGVQRPYALRLIAILAFFVFIPFTLTGCRSCVDDPLQLGCNKEAAAAPAKSGEAGSLVTNTTATSSTLVTKEDLDAATADLRTFLIQLTSDVGVIKGQGLTTQDKLDKLTTLVNDKLSQIGNDGTITDESLAQLMHDLGEAAPTVMDEATRKGGWKVVQDLGVGPVPGVSGNRSRFVVEKDVVRRYAYCVEPGVPAPAMGTGCRAVGNWLMCGKGDSQLLRFYKPDGPPPPNSTPVPTAVFTPKPGNTPVPTNTDESATAVPTNTRPPDTRVPPTDKPPTTTPTNTPTLGPSCEWNFDHFWGPEQCRWFDSQGLPVRISIEKRIFLPDKKTTYTENWHLFMAGYKGFVTGEGDYTIYCASTTEADAHKDGVDHAERRRTTEPEFIRPGCEPNCKTIGEVTDAEMRSWGIISDTCPPPCKLEGDFQQLPLGDASYSINAGKDKIYILKVWTNRRGMDQTLFRVKGKVDQPIRLKPHNGGDVTYWDPCGQTALDRNWDTLAGYPEKSVADLVAQGYAEWLP